MTTYKENKVYVKCRLTRDAHPKLYGNPKIIKRNAQRYECTLYNVCGDEVGYVDSVQTRAGFFETHSFIDWDFCGRGLGGKMYARVIDFHLKEGNDIRSSASPSIAAENVWKSKYLNKKFVIKKLRKRYCVISKR